MYDNTEEINVIKAELLQDGTLVISTDKYDDVKRVLVEYDTKGTLYYLDNDAN